MRRQWGSTEESLKEELKSHLRKSKESLKEELKSHWRKSGEAMRRHWGSAEESLKKNRPSERQVKGTRKSLKRYWTHPWLLVRARLFGTRGRKKMSTSKTCTVTILVASSCMFRRCFGRSAFTGASPRPKASVDWLFPQFFPKYTNGSHIDEVTWTPKPVVWSPKRVAASCTTDHEYFMKKPRAMTRKLRETRWAAWNYDDNEVPYSYIVRGWAWKYKHMFNLCICHSVCMYASMCVCKLKRV